LCRASTEHTNKDILKEKVNLTARIAASRGFQGKHADGIVRRIVEVAEDPMAIKENLLFVADSIMRHAANDGPKTVVRFERAFGPALKLLFRAALRRTETRQVVGDYLRKKLLPTWRQNCWFPKEMPSIMRLLTGKAKAGKEEEGVLDRPMTPAFATEDAASDFEPSDNTNAPWEPAYDPFAERSPYSMPERVPTRESEVPQPKKGAPAKAAALAAATAKAKAPPPPAPVAFPHEPPPDVPTVPVPTEMGDMDLEPTDEEDEDDFVPTATGDPYTETVHTDDIDGVIPTMPGAVRMKESQSVQYAQGAVTPGHGLVSPQYAMVSPQYGASPGHPGQATPLMPGLPGLSWRPGEATPGVGVEPTEVPVSTELASTQAASTEGSRPTLVPTTSGARVPTEVVAPTEGLPPTEQLPGGHATRSRRSSFYSNRCSSHLGSNSCDPNPHQSANYTSYSAGGPAPISHNISTS